MSSTTTACPVARKNPAGQQETIAPSSNDSHIDSGDCDKTDNPESRDNVIVTAAIRRRFQDHAGRLDPSVAVSDTERKLQRDKESPVDNTVWKDEKAR
jgi:hypothetical protein